MVTATDCAGNMSDCKVTLKQPASLPASDDDLYLDDDTDQNTAAPSASPSQSTAGVVRKNVKVVDGAPNTSLVTSTEDLMLSVLTNGEQQAVEDGSNANIELRIKNVDSSVSQTDKELIIANLSGYSVGEYLDITLWKRVGSSSEKTVTNIATPISVTVSVPADLRSESREFVVLRVHKGKVSILEDLDSAINTITFKTDRFSTYALAYRTVDEAAKTTGTTKKSNAKKSTAGKSSAAKPAVNKSKAVRKGQTGSFREISVIDVLATDPSPAAGDTAPLLPIAIVFLCSLSGILVTMVLRRKM